MSAIGYLKSEDPVKMTHPIPDFESRNMTKKQEFFQVLERSSPRSKIKSLKSCETRKQKLEFSILSTTLSLTLRTPLASAVRHEAKYGVFLSASLHSQSPGSTALSNPMISTA